MSSLSFASSRGPTRRQLLTRAAIALGAAALPLVAACSPASQSQTSPTAQAQPTPGAAAQGSATQAAPAAAGSATIDWWVPNFHSAGAKIMKDKFEAANPSIKINQIETVSAGLYEKIYTTLQGSDQPDLIDVQNPWNPIFSQAGLVTDLSSRGLDTSDWLPNSLKTAQYQGKLYGVPFRTDALALVWNKDIFQAAGLDPEKPPQTWEELASMAQQANQPPNRYGFGVIAGDPGNTFYRLSTFIWANGGDVLNTDFTQATCNQPACVEAVQFYTDLATKYHAAPDSALQGTTEMFDGLFAGGKLALYETGQFIQTTLQSQAPNLKWGATTTIKRQQIACLLGGWNWVIPKNAKHVDATWTLVNFMSQPQNMADMAYANTVFPARNAGLKDPRFQVPTLAPFAQELQYARLAPPIPQWADIVKAMLTGVQSIITGQSGVQAAMDQAASDINGLLQKS
jgi:multiple sugar transport system substrate-binding protein